MPRLLGADLVPAQLHARTPIHMDGLDRRQRHQHRRIHRRAGPLQHAADAEWLVGMLGQCHRSSAMSEHHLIAHLHALRAGDIGADHRVVQIIEGLAPGEGQRVAGTVAVMLEIATGGADHPVAAPGITQRQRHRPLHLRQCRQFLVGLPGHVVGRVADMEHRVQQQVHRPRARADDQISARNGAGEPLMRLHAHALHAQQQGHAEGDDQDGQGHAQRTAAQAGPGKVKHGRLRRG